MSVDRCPLDREVIVSDGPYQMELPSDLAPYWRISSTNSPEHPCPFTLELFAHGDFTGSVTDIIEVCEKSWNDAFEAAVKKARDYDKTGEGGRIKKLTNS